jgi:hypothetical protein
MKKVLKMFIALTVVCGLFTAYQFLGRSTYRTNKIERSYELSRKKVDVDFRIEMARDKLEKGSLTLKKGTNKNVNKSLDQVETSNELKALTAERDALIQQMNDQKAKEEREAKAEEQKTKTENLRLTLSFLGTLASTVATVIIALINKKKE